MVVRVKEQSLLAGIAAKWLGASKVAMVIGNTIYLHNASRAEFIKNLRWLRHEVAHVKQFARHGTIRFLFLYFLESIRKGYFNNKFEIEARSKEVDASILDDVTVQ